MCNKESEREFAEASTVAALVESSRTPVSLVSKDIFIRLVDMKNMIKP